MTKETSPKDRKLRHAEYYGMTEIFDKIYSKSLKGDNSEEGREAIHKKQQTVEEWKISWLCSNPVLSKRATIEFADNRISKFIAQKGRCAVTGEELILSEMHCHHIIPYHESKSDSYENLVIVTEEVHRVIHATQSETIEELLKLNPKQKEKLNELRLKVGNEEIS